jgi:hypothetical protein
MTRILELRSRIRSQIDDLNSTVSPAKDPSSGNSNDQEPKAEEAMRRLLKTNNRTTNPYELTEEERREWRLATTIRQDGFVGGEPRQCKECKYKEGLEEVINILAVCGFLRRGEEGSGIETPRQRGLDELDPLQDPRKPIWKQPMSPFYY